LIIASESHTKETARSDTQAITSYQHALDLARDLGDGYHEADTLTHLGDTHHATGNLQAARDAWQQALTILDDLDHPDAGQVRTKLASLDPVDRDARPDGPTG
jgi:tetratricopeptide (TPR) repeat protein